MFLNQITLIEGIQKFVFAYAMFKICFFYAGKEFHGN